MPLFSIVTVCFNSSRTIARTIESVLVQDYNDYEYIIIDGGSTDGTVEIIKRYEDLFEGRMSWISEKDEGIYDAFNKGIKRSVGDYVWIVNSDDYIEPTALQNVFDFIVENSCCADRIISCGMRLVTAEGKQIGTTVYSSDDLEWRMSVDSIAFAHPSTFIPKSLYERYGYYDTNYKIMADLDWSRCAWSAGEAILYAPFIVTNMTTGGISSRLNLWENIKEREYYFSKYYPCKKDRKTRLRKWLVLYLKGRLKSTIKNWIR